MHWIKKISFTLAITALLFIGVGLVHKQATAQATCSVPAGGATFSPFGDQTNPNLSKGEGSSAPVTVTIKTKDCVGQNITISIYSYGRTTIGTAFSKKVKVSNDTITLHFLANELPCTSSRSIPSEPDCFMGIQVQNDFGDRLIQTYDAAFALTGDTITDALNAQRWKSDPALTQNKGILYYFCFPLDETCEATFFGGSSAWIHQPVADTGYERINYNGQVIGEGNITDFNTESLCYDDDPNSPTYGKYKPNCNELLAPLPGLTVVDSSVSLGQYLNTIVRLAIGLVVVLAVVMLIVYGFQYMSTGSITGKADFKDKIKNALIGVLIALGMFTILATINPTLLNLNPSIDPVTIQGDLQSTSESPYYAGEKGAQARCDALDNALFGSSQTFGVEGNRGAASNAKRIKALVEKDSKNNSGFFRVKTPQLFALNRNLVVTRMVGTVTSGPLQGNRAVMEAVYDAAKQYNIDPFIGLQMWKREAGWGAAGVAAKTYNLGNLIAGSAWDGPTYTSQSSGLKFRDYKTKYQNDPDKDRAWKESARDYFSNLNQLYIAQGLDTVEEIIPKYAPCGIDNTLSYINNVKNDMQKDRAALGIN